MTPRRHNDLVDQLDEALQAALEPLRDPAEPDAALLLLGRSDRRKHYYVVLEMNFPSETSS